MPSVLLAKSKSPVIMAECAKKAEPIWPAYEGEVDDDRFPLSNFGGGGCHDFGKPILGCCVCRDHFYVLLEGGELWRTKNPSFSCWELVYHFSLAVTRLEVSRGHVIGVVECVPRWTPIEPPKAVILNDHYVHTLICKKE